MNIWKYVKSIIFTVSAAIFGLLLFSAMQELFLTGTFTLAARDKPADAFGAGLFMSGLLFYATVSAIEDAFTYKD